MLTFQELIADWKKQ